MDEVSFIISGSLEVIQDDEVRDAEITSASERWPGSHDVSCWYDCGGGVVDSCSDGAPRDDMPPPPSPPKNHVYLNPILYIHRQLVHAKPG